MREPVIRSDLTGQARVTKWRPLHMDIDLLPNDVPRIQAPALHRLIRLQVAHPHNATSTSLVAAELCRLSGVGHPSPHLTLSLASLFCVGSCTSFVCFIAAVSCITARSRLANRFCALYECRRVPRYITKAGAR
jgi:hypothetical protein